ncbi:glycosyltransferase family 2 protein [Solimonas variicoloris]|uniref:glycosyltransferase family 2 protein n=1 Tax=Solimonas variicoloris TaxID=254408 RepID=UPI00036C9908|nr:glycosyltransferase family 2 protein [Solimonas variicoloris]
MDVLLMLLSLALGVPAAVACAYLLGLTLLSAPLPTPPRSSRRLRFDVIVPAHNEAAVIARTLQSLARLDWPAEGFRRVVVADNCSDATAALARAAGATVFERHDLSRRGKGYALAHAFAASAAQGWADAVVVVDADSEVSPNLLEAFAARIENGGAEALQAHYGVLNPLASWRTRLIEIAHGSFHVLRSRARERLALSCGLRGNGWCVTHALLRAVPFAAFSLTEDLEYGLVLGLAGRRVHYAHEARADAEMTSSAQVALRQRQRWEQGRFALVRAFTPRLLGAWLRRRERVAFDLLCDLLVPPLSYLCLHVLLFLAVAGGAPLAVPALWPGLAAALACVAVLVVYVLRGWALSDIGWRGALDLARVPLFLLWKLRVLATRGLREWVPTSRHP